MKISSFKLFAIKVALFSTVLGYMAADLWLIHGPMYHFLHSGEAPGKESVVAEVYGEPITWAQLQRYTAEQDALAGRDKPEDARRATMVMGMVREALLRLRARYNDTHLPPFEKEAAEEAARLFSRARSEQELTTNLASQGYTKREFQEKLQARMRSQALLERAVAPASEVNQAAVAVHYQQLKDELSIPASRPVRHIFLSTLKRDADAIRQAAELLVRRLNAGEDFATLARESSEDDRTSQTGGNLGVLYDDGTLPLPELKLFGEGAVSAGTPTLVQSRWGWHIILAGPITPAYTPSLDECRESLRTAIMSAQRELGVNAYFKSAVKEGFKQQRIKIHVK